MTDAEADDLRELLIWIEDNPDEGWGFLESGIRRRLIDHDEFLDRR